MSIKTVSSNIMDNLPEDFVKERQFLKRKIKALASEYHVKVTHNFSRYIYVGVKEKRTIALEDAINLVALCAGYEAHRLVIYQNSYGTNLYVRFQDENYAMAAAERLHQLEDYCVDMVSAMLLSWYLEEMLKGNFPWTLALVSIEGRAEFPNPLSQDVLQGLLGQFGDPRINTYQIGYQVEHVQVLFSSMSEALGASIAFGRWFKGNVRENPRFYYAIKIMSSEKEAALLRNIQPSKRETDQQLDAFEMDYFVQKMEIKSSSYAEDAFLPPQSTVQNSESTPRNQNGSREFRSWRGRNNRGRWLNENKNNRFQRRTSQTFTNQDFPSIRN